MGTKIGKMKDGVRVSGLSKIELTVKATDKNTRGRDAQKCRNELAKRRKAK